MHVRRFIELCVLLTVANVYATPAVTVEQPAGTNLTSTATIYFGGMQARYVDPASKVQALDGTHTVTFTNIPQSTFSTYQIERSNDGNDGWSQLFAPDLAPDAAGVIQFHDESPRVVAFYRLLILTDTRRVFTIRNTGSTDLTSIQVTVVGTNSPNFELDTASMNTTLAPAASTTFSVTYVAGDTNVRAAELRITSNVPGPFILTLIGGDLPPPVPPVSLTNIVLTPAGPGAPAGIAGNVSGGTANGSVFLEASSDLGQLDPWEVIATIPLNAGGNATFGNPNPITDPASAGSSRNFYRLRVN